MDFDRKTLICQVYMISFFEKCYILAGDQKQQGLDFF